MLRRHEGRVSTKVEAVMTTYYHDHTTGWICPRCKRVHAPWVGLCRCTDYEVVTRDFTCDGSCLQTSAPCPIHKARPSEVTGDE